MFAEADGADGAQHSDRQCRPDLVGALAMWLQGVSGDGFSQVEELVWMPAIGAAYRVGVDGISLPLVLLSAVLFLVSLIYASSLRDRPRAYVALILLLETAAIGTFTALDGILFYVSSKFPWCRCIS